MARLAASRLADRVVVLTERDADAWRQRFGIGERVCAIWNPIPHFDEKPSPLDERRKTVLAVGRLTKQKGFDLLLGAWKRLGKVRDGWTLRIVGGGKGEAMLKQIASEQGIVDSVVFVGQTRAVVQEYRAASIYVMSSRWEGLPMTLLEAQYFGLPSVATDCPTGPREVLAKGSGRLVKSEDPQALADELAELMANPQEQATMARAAQENARRYRPEGIWQKWEALFAKISSD